MSTDANNPRIRYAIDAADKICFVDDAWGVFAVANDGAELTRSAILGRSLWDCISDHTTRTLYRRVVARVRQGQIAELSLRCDGPSCRRLMEMTIRPAADGGVEFETRTLSAEDRATVPLMSRTAPRSSEMLRMCAWCNQVNIGTAVDQWVEVEAAMEHLRVFEHDAPPQLTHGICEPCLAHMMATIEQMAPTG
jgi:hypothetical protein